MYDVSDPRAPRFIQYLNNRDFSAEPQAGMAGDFGPEGVLFIPRSDSPIDCPLLVVSNETSDSVTL